MITFSETENFLKTGVRAGFKKLDGSFLKKTMETVLKNRGDCSKKKVVGTVLKNVMEAVTPRCHCTSMRIISHHRWRLYFKIQRN